jgi:hypothetical protein
VKSRGSKEVRTKLMEGTLTKGTRTSEKNEDTIKLIQNDIDSNNGEKFSQDKDQTVSDNSDDKNVEGMYSHINKVVVSQELKCGGDKKGVNKDKNYDS